MCEYCFVYGGDAAAATAAVGGAAAFKTRPSISHFSHFGIFLHRQNARIKSYLLLFFGFSFFYPIFFIFLSFLSSVNNSIIFSIHEKKMVFADEYGTESYACTLHPAIADAALRAKPVAYSVHVFV